MTSLTPRLDRLEGYHNLAINGAMDFFQRGTSITNRGAGDSNCLADRFRLTLVGTTGIFRMDRSTDVPTVAEAGFTFPYSLAIQCTTADASVAAGDLVILRHNLEGSDYAAIANGKNARISFWVKSVLAGTYCLELRNDANDRYQIREYVLPANTWTRVTVDFATDTGGTWRTDNGVGLSLCWTLMCGSTFQSPTTNAWAAGNFRGTANQANLASSTSNIFYLTGLMVVEGSFDSASDLPFKRAGRTIGDELRMCQRYYEHSYSVGISWGTSDTSQLYYLSARAAATTAVDNISIPFRTTKRTNSYTVGLMDSGLVSGRWLDHNGNAIFDNSNYNKSDSFLSLYDNSATGLTAGGIVRAYGYWYIDAEL